MQLWTFQSLQSVDELTKTGILRASWDRYPAEDYWTKAYQWIVHEMETRNISCHGFAPIWAFHSSGEWEQGPTLDDASNLLPLMALEEGIKTIEFICPDELVLLSDYGSWNEIIELFLKNPNNPSIPQKKLNALFHFDPLAMDKYDSIQATFPYLKKEWVVDIRPLSEILIQDDWDIDRRA